MPGLSTRDHQQIRRESMLTRNLRAWWRRRRDTERREREALAARLRRELVGYEQALSRAAGILEAARQEERDAGLALAGREAKCIHAAEMGISGDSAVMPDHQTLDVGPTSAKLDLGSKSALAAAQRRLASATKGRELAWLGFQIARARVNVHSGALLQLEQELSAMAEEPDRVTLRTPPGAAR